MGALDAVYEILQKAGEPLHYEEITRRILEKGLWKSEGKTPEATVNAQLAVDIKMNGNASRFARVGRGVFGLRGQSANQQSSNAKSLSFTDAAEAVLKKDANQSPMHYREITQKALGEGLLKTQGMTPEATMYAQILTEVKRKKRGGTTPRFTKHGGGYVGLSEWMGKGLAFDIEQHNRELRKTYLKNIQKAGPEEFERLIPVLLAEMGLEDITSTPYRKDGGVDVRGLLVISDVIKMKLAVQVKCWQRNNVQAPEVQKLRGSLAEDEHGLIITTKDFSIGAQEEAVRHGARPIYLMKGDELVKLLIENEIGVKKTARDILELDTGNTSED